MADPATWRDRYEYLRAQRDIFARRATQCRKDAIEARKQRKWLDALQLDCQAAEHRESRDRYKHEAKAAKTQLGRTTPEVTPQQDQSP